MNKICVAFRQIRRVVAGECREVKEMPAEKDQKKVDRVTKAFLKMRKFDLSVLEKAFAG